MFSIVHVLLPFSDEPPALAIGATLAPFERGGRGGVPDEWLAFADETEHVRALHTGRWVFTDLGGNGLQIEGGDHWHLDLVAVGAEMARRELRCWDVCFREVEPDLAAFAGGFVEGLERHPITGGYGRWLNPLGRWDWWDLGGRFDGRIVGEPRRGATGGSVSSGPNRGRDLLANVGSALQRALGSEPRPELDVRADDNVEMVSRLLEDARSGLEHAVPGAVLLPPGTIEDRLRWLGSWPQIRPPETLDLLGVPRSAAWREAVIAAYARHVDHWAAGVAYHH